MLQMIYFFSEMTSKYVGLLEILYRHFYSGMKTVEESREPHACWRILSCPVLSRASCHLSSLGYPCSKGVEATSIEHFMQGCLSKTVTGQKLGLLWVYRTACLTAYKWIFVYIVKFSHRPFICDIPHTQLQFYWRGDLITNYRYLPKIVIIVKNLISIH